MPEPCAVQDVTKRGQEICIKQRQIQQEGARSVHDTVLPAKILEAGIKPVVVCAVQARHPLTLHSWAMTSLGVWRNGSASDSRSEGWEFESLCPQCLQRRLQLHAAGAWSPCALVGLQFSGRGAGALELVRPRALARNPPSVPATSLLWDSNPRPPAY